MQYTYLNLSNVNLGGRLEYCVSSKKPLIWISLEQKKCFTGSGADSGFFSRSPIRLFSIPDQNFFHFFHFSIRVWDPESESGIRKKLIPDPGVKKAPDFGSATLHYSNKCYVMFTFCNFYIVWNYV